MDLLESKEVKSQLALESGVFQTTSHGIPEDVFLRGNGCKPNRSIVKYM